MSNVGQANLYTYIFEKKEEKGKRKREKLQVFWSLDNCIRSNYLCFI